ncbi:MAG: STAS domain-containing protein [Candidatus Eisenbacteria bacterium]
MANWKQLKVDVQDDSAQIIYRLSGLLTDTSDAFQARSDPRGCRKPAKRFIVDLSGVPHVTSAGVGILAAAYTSAKRNEKTVVVTGPASREESLLKLVGLWDLLEHHETVEQALG